jgi:hypothetical protein
MIEDKTWLALGLQEMVVPWRAHDWDIRLNYLIDKRLASNRLNETFTAFWNEQGIAVSQIGQIPDCVRGELIAPETSYHFRYD